MADQQFHVPFSSYQVRRYLEAKKGISGKTVEVILEAIDECVPYAIRTPGESTRYLCPRGFEILPVYTGFRKYSVKVYSAYGDQIFWRRNLDAFFRHYNPEVFDFSRFNSGVELLVHILEGEK